MPAYFIAEIEVTNAAGYERYRPVAAATIAQFGGKYIARGGKTELLEGEPEPSRLVIVEFPDVATARRWYTSPEYQEALKIRQVNSRGRVLLVEG